MKGDDFLGSYLAGRLAQVFKDRSDIAVFDGRTVPENYTGAIRRENPSHIILIDAACMGETPGFIRTIDKNQISKYHLSTHAMPLSFLIKYLEQSTEAKIILIGIEPKEMELADGISKEVFESVEKVIDVFVNVLSA